MAQPQQHSQLPPQYRQALLEQQQRQQQEQQQQQQQQQAPQTTTSQAPTLDQIEKQYSQLPPQYRQAVLEKQQREHQMQMLQQQQQKLHGQSQQQLQQHQQQQQQPQQAPQPQPQRQTFAPDSRRQQSASLASSPAKSATTATSNRIRVASAPLTSTYRAAGGGRDSDTASTYSVTSGPGRAHWKASQSQLPRNRDRIAALLSALGQDAVASLVSLTADIIVESAETSFALHIVQRKFRWIKY
ncbi:hypothetical protein BGZ47_003813 [Haplosporangium gracile]|nr:hypothetical protein BGZ47_003813 [Haplosporangium gracile]